MKLPLVSLSSIVDPTSKNKEKRNVSGKEEALLVGHPLPLLHPLLPLQGAQSILRGEAHQAGGHDHFLVWPLPEPHQVQLVEKTSREGVDFPEIWLCPSPSFSFQRLANLGYMYIYLYLVFQLSSMSCLQFFSRQVNNYFRGRSKSEGKFRCVSRN